MVLRPVALIVWGEFVERVPLQFQVSLHIEMGCVQTFMPQPQGDDFRCNSALQDRVAKGMRRDTAMLERRNFLGRFAQPTAQLPGDSGTAHRLTKTVGQ